MNKTFTHPDADLEVEVAPGHETPYIEAGWVEKKPRGKKSTTTEGTSNDD